jgi:hypothetical protein
MLAVDLYFRPNHCLQFLLYSSKDTNETLPIFSNFEGVLYFYFQIEIEHILKI